jgi:negative regulator of sigma E activity
MTEDERASQLSAMFDGELPPAECELLARRLSRDEALRRQWGSYALIGAAVRGEPIFGRGAAGSPADVAARVRQALAQPAAAVTDATDADIGGDGVAPDAAGGRRPRMPRWAVPVSSFGLAASVAVLGVAAAALFWLRGDAPTGATVATVVPSVRPASAAEVVVPMPLPAAPAAPVAQGASPGTTGRADDSYTVPPPTQGNVGLAGGATLANFLVAHSEVSMPMLRRNALSTLVAVPVDAEAASAAPAVPLPADPVPVTTDAPVDRAVERP